MVSVAVILGYQDQSIHTSLANKTVSRQSSPERVVLREGQDDVDQRMQELVD